MRQDYIYDIKGIRGKLHNIGAAWFSGGLFGEILRSTAKSMKKPQRVRLGFWLLGDCSHFSAAQANFVMACWILANFAVHGIGR